MTRNFGWCTSVQPMLDSTGRLSLVSSAPGRQPIRIAPPMGRLLHSLFTGEEVEIAPEMHSHVDQAIAYLSAEKFIRPVTELDWHQVDERFSRQARYFAQLGVAPTLAQFRLENANVLVIGLGGVGGAVSELLVRSGIGQLTGLDFDVVNVENIPRHALFTLDDVGRDKALSAKVHLDRIARGTGTRIAVYETLIESNLDIERVLQQSKVCLVILAADTPQISIRQWTYEACAKVGVPFAMAGQALPNVFVGPFVDTSYICELCASGLTNEMDLQDIAMLDNHSWTLPALGSADMLAATLLVGDLVQYLVTHKPPKTSGTQFSWNTETFEVSRKSVIAPGCTKCAAEMDKAA